MGSLVNIRVLRRICRAPNRNNLSSALSACGANRLAARYLRRLDRDGFGAFSMSYALIFEVEELFLPRAVYKLLK